MGKNIILSEPAMGTINAGEKINQAIEQVANSGGGEVFLEAGTYRVLGSTTIKLQSNVSLRGVPGATVIDFSGRDKYSSEEFKYLVSADGEIEKEKSIKLKEDTVKGSYKIKVENTVGLEEGLLILLKSDERWYEGETPEKIDENLPLDIGELCEINNIKGNEIQLKGVIHDKYLTEKNAKIYKVNLEKNILVEGITFIGKGRNKITTLDADYGVGFTYCENVTVTNCKFEKIDTKQLEFRSCYKFTVDNCYFKHDKYTTINSTGASVIPCPPQSPACHGKEKEKCDDKCLDTRGAVQYQVRVADACMYGTIINCTGIGGRHFFNTGHSNLMIDGSAQNSRQDLFGINRYITVSNCKSTNTWHAAYSTHNDAEYVVFDNCIATASGVAGFDLRSNKNIVKNSTVINSESGVRFSINVRNAEVSNNTIYNCNTAGIGISDTLKLDFEDITIKENTIRNCGKGIIIERTIKESKNTVQSGKIIIMNNNIREFLGNAIMLNVTNGEAIVKGNIILGKAVKLDDNKNIEHSKCGFVTKELKSCILESNCFEKCYYVTNVSNNLIESKYFYNNSSIGCIISGKWEDTVCNNICLN